MASNSVEVSNYKPLKEDLDSLALLWEQDEDMEIEIDKNFKDVIIYFCWFSSKNWIIYPFANCTNQPEIYYLHLYSK